MSNAKPASRKQLCNIKYNEKLSKRVQINFIGLSKLGAKNTR